MITLELQYLINDDLGMFGQVPMMLGRGWGLRVNDLVYTKLLAPGKDEGGSTDFFAATHTVTGQKGNANYQSSASSALTSAGLQAAKILFDRQVDPAGKKLGIDAEILLYPPELDVAAIELMNAQFIVMAGLASTAAATKQPNTNIWKGRFKPVMSRYLSDSNYSGYSTTGWYLLGNPGVIPVIQIAALNGQMTPTVQTASQDWQFNQLGISTRGWGGVGVSMQNYRGGVLSAGA
jgi:phage major head subunit gpT-like protein